MATKKQRAAPKKAFHVRAVERRQHGSMDLHGGELLLIAFRARNDARAEAKTNSASLPPDALIAVVLACAACEAFIDELGVEWRQVRAELIACAAAIRATEQSHGTIEEKYIKASEALKATFAKGRNPYQ